MKRSMPRSTTRRIYVHAVGACTPMAPGGASWRASVPALLRGETAVRLIDHFDTTNYPSRVAAWIGNDALHAAGDRRLPMLARALDEIAELADLAAYQGPRCGVFLGAESGRASPQAILQLTKAAAPNGTFDHGRFVALAHAAADTGGAVAARSVSPAAVAASLAARLGAYGPVQTISLACASGASAIIAAVRHLRLGLCDTAVAGGVGADVDPFMLVGFGKLGALSAAGVSRPFDRARDGFVVGEGAALVLLSTMPPHHGPVIEIVGVGASLDGYHLTAPHPDGDGAQRAIRAALQDANCTTVDYVQAHGTSTPLNDATECQAIARVFADTDAPPPAVSSIKGAVGHWIAGAGAVGFLGAVEALQGNLLPTAGLTIPDAACSAAHVMVDATGQRTAVRPVHRALVNAFAFGGANAALVLETPR